MDVLYFEFDRLKELYFQNDASIRGKDGIPYMLHQTEMIEKVSFKDVADVKMVVKNIGYHADDYI